ncbi:MAG: ATP-grasp domain-containing protein [Alphaproteobacteria bacterium]|nr:ATP-grasp domain-containing protein [Alphaproteobacteria bacterium]
MTKSALSPHPGRAIVMYGRSLMALEIAHSLGERGIEVIGCDDVDFTVLSFSRFVNKTFTHAPYAKDPEKFIDILEKHIIKNKPKDDRPYILIPVFRETPVIAHYAERLSRHIQIAAPALESIERIHPKDKLAQTAQNLGIHIPRTWLPGSEEDLKDVDFPALIKPADDVGGRGISKVKDREELLDAYRQSSARYGRPPLVQQAVTGKDYCLAVLCDDGDIRASMAYRNIRKFPAESGAGIVRETVDDRLFVEVVRPLFKEIGWNGVAEIDFMWDENADSKPWLIEINPRFWAGLFQSVESGIDFPWLLYELTVKGSVPPAGPAKVGQKTKVPTVWLFSAIQDILKSDKDRTAMDGSWEDVLDHIESRSIKEGLRDLDKAIARKMSYKDAYQSLKKIMQEVRDAKSELPLKEDPFIIFGIMFIFSSLIRHGRLPPEIKW